MKVNQLSAAKLFADVRRISANPGARLITDANSFRFDVMRLYLRCTHDDLVIKVVAMRFCEFEKLYYKAMKSYRDSLQKDMFC